MNDFNYGYYFYTIIQNKDSVAEPDVKAAAVWKVLFIIMTTAWTALQSLILKLLLNIMSLDKRVKKALVDLQTPANV